MMQELVNNSLCATSAHHLFFSVKFYWNTGSPFVYLLSMAASVLERQT